MRFNKAYAAQFKPEKGYGVFAAPWMFNAYSGWNPKKVGQDRDHARQVYELFAEKLGIPLAMAHHGVVKGNIDHFARTILNYRRKNKLAGADGDPAPTEIIEAWKFASAITDYPTDRYAMGAKDQSDDKPKKNWAKVVNRVVAEAARGA